MARLVRGVRLRPVSRCSGGGVVVVIRCPECAHTWKTDRGTISHRYQGSSPEVLAAAQAALERMRSELPLPLHIVDEDAPGWLKELGAQGSLADLIEGMAEVMEMDDG